MANLLQGKAYRDLVLGRKVDSAATALTNGSVDVFNVVGGRVDVTLVVGKITVAAGAASLVTMGNNPTLAGATSVDFAVAADIDSSLVGDAVMFESTAGQLTTTAGPGISSPIYNLIATTGTIYAKGSAAEGTVLWTLFYVPIDAGAYITAA
jgi:hypothetical protein